VTAGEILHAAQKRQNLEVFLRRTHAASNCGTCGDDVRRYFVHARFEALCDRSAQFPLPFQD
ncbi:MAG TPA: (2Fe-2S)-binding protein, partial [Leptospiraceae bacterium]|nr:(2Fe-2S)-binding protein [Leptospiraceae bacterium]